uniref:Uncharacterized protein n=1 Tax=Arundo donax TaxID=35708 RepID=A0A0A8Z755_ARUDO
MRLLLISYRFVMLLSRINYCLLLLPLSSSVRRHLDSSAYQNLYFSLI